MIKTERKQIKWSQTECCLPPASSLALIPSYMEDNVYTHTHAHTHAHARTHTRAHTHMLARARTHTHAHTHTTVLGDPSVFFRDGCLLLC